MTSNVTLEGAKKAVFFPFQGEKWGIKLLIGAAISLTLYIPLVGLAGWVALMGYFGQIMKGVIVRDEDPSLPEWKDWGLLFTDGIKVAGVTLIYSLPGIVLILGGYILFLVLDFALAFSATGTGSSSSNIPALALGNMVGMFGGLGLAGLGFILLLAASVFMPPALGNLIAKDQFGAAFRIREWWPILKHNLSGHLLALALLIGSYSLMVLVIYCLYFTLVLCPFVPFLLGGVIVLLGMIAFSLYAIAYRDGVKKMAA